MVKEIGLGEQRDFLSSIGLMGPSFGHVWLGLSLSFNSKEKKLILIFYTVYNWDLYTKESRGKHNNHLLDIRMHKKAALLCLVEGSINHKNAI